MSTTKTTEYAAARDGEIIGATFPELDRAKQQVAYVSESMTNAGLTPDIELVEVTKTVTISKARAYKEPTGEPETEPTDQVENPDTETGD
jgi:hypothetical protein